MSSVSSFSMAHVMRGSLQRLRADLDRAQLEAGSGRAADPGLALGHGVQRSINLRNGLTQNDAYIDGGRLIVARLEASQTTLAGAADVVNVLRNDSIVAMGGGDVSGLIASARVGLSRVVEALNTQAGGQYLFSGVDVRQPPIQSDAQAVSKAAIAQAFTTTFGVAPGSPAAAAITPAAMQGFLDTQFAALFQPSQWAATWAQSSSTAQTAEVAPGERLTVSATAHEDGVRAMAQGLSMLADLNIDALNPETRRVTLDAAARVLGGANGAITEIQARLGTVQREATSAIDHLDAQNNLTQTQIGALENVDPAEVAARLSLLTTQLETSYALTSRMNKMNLLNYL